MTHPQKMSLGEKIVQLREGGGGGATGTEVEPVGSAGQMTNWPGDSHFISFPFGYHSGC